MFCSLLCWSSRFMRRYVQVCVQVCAHMMAAAIFGLAEPHLTAQSRRIRRGDDMPVQVCAQTAYHSACAVLALPVASLSTLSGILFQPLPPLSLTLGATLPLPAPE